MGNAKMKTNRAAAKRFKVTGSGRIKRNKAYHGHLFTAKSPKRLRNLRKGSLLAPSDEARARKMLGGGK
jgi:large subunit ribosomal protein L35